MLITKAVQSNCKNNQLKIVKLNSILQGLKRKKKLAAPLSSKCFVNQELGKVAQTDLQIFSWHRKEFL